jgi:hypothetical protein
VRRGARGSERRELVAMVENVLPRIFRLYSRNIAEFIIFAVSQRIYCGYKTVASENAIEKNPVLFCSYTQ